MWVMAVLVDATVASPLGASIELPSLCRNALGGSMGDWREVIKLCVLPPVKDKKRSNASLSLRNRRSDFWVVKSSLSRNGRSPSGDAPRPDR